MNETSSSTHHPRIITISGSHSGIGKTLLATLLIKILPGFAAIKLSHADLLVFVTDDLTEIMREGKDTRALKEAGAEEVILVRAGERDIPDALSIAFDMVYKSGSPGVIIEGNAAAKFLKPGLSFFVTDGDLAGIKPDALPILEKADVIILNPQAACCPTEAVSELEKALRVHNPAAAICLMARFFTPDEEVLKLLRRELRTGG